MPLPPCPLNREVTCPMVTPGYHAFSNGKLPWRSLTGGIQFVNVSPVIHKTFGRAKFCNRYELQTKTTFKARFAVPECGRARESFHSQDGGAARKSQVSEQAFCILKAEDCACRSGPDVKNFLSF